MHASPGTTGNVCPFIEVNQLFNVEHNTSLVYHSGHFWEGGIGFMTRFKSFIYCRHKCRPTIDLSIRAQLASPIVIPVPGPTLDVGSNNPDKVGVAISGASVVVKIIVNGLVPSVVCGVHINATIVFIWVCNLELLLLLTLLDSAQNLHDQKAFLLPHPFLLAMSQEAFQGTIPRTPIAIVAAR